MKFSSLHVDRFRNKSCVIQQLATCQFKLYAVAHLLKKVQDTHTVCSILNHQSVPITMPKNNVIALASNVNAKHEYQPLVDSQIASTLSDDQEMSKADL